MWRDPSKRDAPIWNNFSRLQQSSQEVIAAGFEFRGRKLSTRSERGFKHLDSVISLPLNYELQGVHSVPRVAVLLHAYYLDLLAEFHQALRNIPFPFALFISTIHQKRRRQSKNASAALIRGRSKSAYSQIGVETLLLNSLASVTYTVSMILFCTSTPKNR